MVDALFKFLKLLEDTAGIIKIVERIKADGPERRSNGPSYQSGTSGNVSRSTEHKKFSSKHQHKGQTEGGVFKKEEH